MGRAAETGLGVEPQRAEDGARSQMAIPEAEPLLLEDEPLLLGPRARGRISAKAPTTASVTSATSTSPSRRLQSCMPRQASDAPTVTGRAMRTSRTSPGHRVATAHHPAGCSAWMRSTHSAWAVTRRLRLRALHTSQSLAEAANMFARTAMASTGWSPAGANGNSPAPFSGHSDPARLAEASLSGGIR